MAAALTAAVAVRPARAQRASSRRNGPLPAAAAVPTSLHPLRQTAPWGNAAGLGSISLRRRNDRPVRTGVFNPDKTGAVAPTAPRRKLLKIFEAELPDYASDLDVTGGASGKMAVATASGEVLIIDMVSGETLDTLAGDAMGTNCCKFSPDGKALATGGWDGKMKVWGIGDDGKGELWTETKVGKALVDFVAWSGSGGLVAGAAGAEIQVAPAPSGPTDDPKVFNLTPVGSSVTALSFSSKDEVMAACYGGVYCVPVNAEGEVNLGGVYSWQSSIVTMALSPSEKWIAGGCQDESCHIWDKVTGEDFAMWGYASKVAHVVWSDDSRYLATAGGMEPNVWDFSGSGPIGSAPISCMGHRGKITALDFNDGTILAVGGSDGGILIFDVAIHGDGQPKGCQRCGGASGPGEVSRVKWVGEDTLVAGYEEGVVIVRKMVDADA